MVNCNCHRLPFLNDDDRICRKRWTEYEALVFFLEKGLTYTDAKICVSSLEVEKHMVESRKKLDEDIATIYSNFQLRQREVLSVEKASNILRRFIYKQRESRQKIASYTKTSKLAKQVKGKTKTTLKDIVKARPNCSIPDCNRVAKKRYYRGKNESNVQKYGSKCDLHSRKNPKMPKRSYKIFKRKDRK